MFVEHMSLCIKHMRHFYYKSVSYAFPRYVSTEVKRKDSLWPKTCISSLSLLFAMLLQVIVGAGTFGCMLYCIRLAIMNPDVSWNKKKNPVMNCCRTTDICVYAFLFLK